MEIELIHSMKEAGFWEGESPFGKVLFCNTIMEYLARIQGCKPTKLIINIRATVEEGYQKIEFFRHRDIISFGRWHWRIEELSTTSNIFIIKDKIITKIIRQIVPKTKFFLCEATLYVKVVAI